MGKRRPDRRRIHRLHRKFRVAIDKAEERVNRKVIERMRALSKDVTLTAKIDAEIEGCRTAKDIDVYCKSAASRAEAEVKGCEFEEKKKR